MLYSHICGQQKDAYEYHKKTKEALNINISILLKIENLHHGIDRKIAM